MSNQSAAFSQLTPDEYLKSRVEFKIEAYRKKGDRYRWAYTVMSATAVIGAAAVPVLINLKGVNDLAPTLVSLLVTILVGLEGLLHFREHWRNYDLMKSFLRQELNLYRAGAGPYRGRAFTPDSFMLFVERIEEQIAKERSQTIEMRTARTKEEGEPKDSRGTKRALPPTKLPPNQSLHRTARKRVAAEP